MVETIDAAAMTSRQIRQELVQALELDLVGPWPGHDLALEQLPGWVRPSNWYLTGFLIPSGTPPEKASDPDEDDDFADVPDVVGPSEETVEEKRAAKKGYFPSSMGLSFLVAADATVLKLRVRWGDYARGEYTGPEGKKVDTWDRKPREEVVAVDLTSGIDPIIRDVPASGGLQTHVTVREVNAEGLRELIPQGTRSVSAFLVNRRTPEESDPDKAYAFQAELEVGCDQPFVPRPDPRGLYAEDWDDQVADLHFADAPEYATGHAVSAEWELTDRACHLLRTAWLPTAEVERTQTVELQGAETSMDALGALQTEEVQTALGPLAEQYKAWIEKQRSDLGKLNSTRREVAEELLRLAGLAAERIEKGIATLASDEDALDAFRVANRAVSRALKQRLKEGKPHWRTFQLAFILLNLPGLADPKDTHRETVDLLFFPTGGGKTEAYLGLAAFAMVLRRLRSRDDEDNVSDDGKGGAGVSVIMRYTLRLLTLDQLSRAAGLVCALELERSEDEARYGTWPFEIGLWVGMAATPNIMGRKGDKRSGTARSKVRQYKNNPGGKPIPIPLASCPWCGKPFEPDSFTLLPDDDHPTELRIVCTNFECDFTRDRPLPIVAVDEPIYRRLPAFLIATADKFASLPWVGQSGALLGSADRFDNDGFYGAAEPGIGTRLSSPLAPPDLIIQDELHLIAGPLGTMAGLYESAIEALCMRTDGSDVCRPKIVASTATARQAANQIQALFGRGITQVFPPPGPDRRDSCFARSDSPDKTPGRRYVGIAAQGRNPKVIIRHVLLALMGAAERLYRDAGGHQNDANPVDPYMTVLSYFNSLRELGGARRILEEEVQNTLKRMGAKRRIGQQHGLFRDRTTFSEVVELTSRVPTATIADHRSRLESPFHDIRRRVDCAIATNMISVGLDITRLGTMVVLGQPKTHSEYIQATSRVGRDPKRPGLVLTLLNIHKPRDRSHYERFKHYHDTFYRSVEVASVTPFSSRALDRGLSAVLVALARHLNGELTPARGAEGLSDIRAQVEATLLSILLDRVREQPILDEAEREACLRDVQNRVGDLLDSWLQIIDGYHEDGVSVQYQQYELDRAKPLLREMLDTDFDLDPDHQRKFRANRSLRDVEPEVNLFLSNLTRVQAEDPA